MHYRSIFSILLPVLLNKYEDAVIMSR